MTWPPKIGEPLPRAAEVIGVREKLIGYSLNLAHDEGGPKAQGFARILGIKIADIALGARERRDRASADNRLSQALTWRNDGNR